MSETSIGVAMKKAGYNPVEAALMVALSKFMNNGGTYDRLIELARTAYGMSGEGHFHGAGDGHTDAAPARQPNGDAAGQGRRAKDGQDSIARPSPVEREGAGHARGADKASGSMPAPRAPSASDLKAMAGVAKVSAATVLDTFMIPGFRGKRGDIDPHSRTPLGDIPARAWKRIEKRHHKNAWVGGRYAELARMMWERVEKQAHIPSGALTRDIIGTADAERMIKEATYTADVQRRITTGVAAALKNVIPVGETADV